MRQASPFGKLLSAVLFTAVCLYVLAYLSEAVKTRRSDMLTEKTVVDGIGLEGIALRFEQTICLEGEPMLFCKNGERVAAGQVFAECNGESAVSSQSAIFFENCDGYEYLSPAEDFSPETLEKLLRAEKLDEKAAGRLVKGRIWFFAAYADEENVPCGTYRLRLDGFDEKLDCALVRSVSDGKGKTAVLLKMRIGKEEYLSLRRCSGELIRNEYTGLEVPADAVTKDGDGNCFVIRFTAAGEKVCPVDIIYESEEFFLIKPTDELFAGAKVKTKMQNKK